MSKIRLISRSCAAGAGCAVLGISGMLACSTPSAPSSSPDSGGCDAANLTCGQILPAATLEQTVSDVTGYSESGHPKCSFTHGVVTAFCGDQQLYASQLANAQTAFPGMVTETNTIGTQSFEVVVGAPTALGSIAEVAALTSNGRYVFDMSLTSAAADIADVRTLATAINLNLSQL